MQDEFPKIGEFLRQLIEERGASHVRVAQALDVDNPRFNKWLNGVESMAPEHLPEIARVLDLSRQDAQKLFALLAAHESQKNLMKVSESEEFEPYQRDPSSFGRYLISLSAKLSRLDYFESADDLPEELFAHHLYTAAAALRSVRKALRPEAELVFNPDNVRFHVRYPANYYVAALMTLSDGEGGDDLALAVQGLVDDVLEAGPGSDDRFLVGLAHQHAIHMNARLGDPRSRFAGQLRPPRRTSSDVHDERMFLVGRAHRADARENDWSALFDALQRPDFQAAVLAFDTSHYDPNPIQTDGWRPNPSFVRKTALKYLSSILSPDVHQRMYAAKRLRILAEHAPALLRDAALDLQVRIIDERETSDIPEEAHSPLLIIRSVNKKE